MPDSDEDVLAASLRHPRSFEELVRRHSGALHAHLTRRTSAGTADDLLADVWVAAFTSRERYDSGRGPVRAWLFGIARHVLLAHHRSVRRDARTGAGSPPDVGSSVDWDAVDARLDATAVAPALRTALAALTGPDLELLLLLVWDHLSPSEAAAVLGIPAGTARSRLHRIRRLLRPHVARPAGTAAPAAPAAAPTRSTASAPSRRAP